MIKKVFSLILFAGLFTSFFTLKANQPEQKIALIPYPQKIEQGEGTFILNTTTQLIINDKGKFTNEIAYFKQW